MHQDTIQYLRDWDRWVKRGAPDMDPYSRREGLCVNVLHYDNRSRTYLLIRDDLAKYFFKYGGDLRYPFGRTNYNQRYIDSTQHEDPARLEWVAKYLNTDRDNA